MVTGLSGIVVALTVGVSEGSVGVDYHHTSRYL